MAHSPSNTISIFALYGYKIMYFINTNQKKYFFSKFLHLRIKKPPVVYDAGALQLGYSAFDVKKNQTFLVEIKFSLVNFAA